MSVRSKQFWADLAERVFWTGAQAGIGVVSVEQLEIPKAWIPVVALGLAAVKALIAKHVGAKDTASTLPASKDPAAPPPNPPA